MITTFTLAYIFNPEHSIINGRFYVFESYQKYTFTKTYKITKTTTAHLSNDYCSSVVKYCIAALQTLLTVKPCLYLILNGLLVGLLETGQPLTFLSMIFYFYIFSF